MAEFFPTHNPVGGQTSYRTDMYVALPGMLSGMGSSRILPHMNDVGAVDSYLLSIAAILPNTEYSVLINGEKVTYQSDDTPTSAEISTGIYNAIRMRPTAYRLADVSKDATANTVSLTARIQGVPLSISAQGFTVTNPVKGTPIYESGAVNLLLPFGRFVGRKKDYKLDPREGVSSVTLIDEPGDTYEVLGITLRSHHTEQVGHFGWAKSGYAFGDTCNVMEDTGTIKGVWTECVEPDLKIGEKAYCAIAPGQKSKLTRDPSGKDLSQVCRIVGATEPTIGGFMALCQFNRYGTW
jgi:hypothetical protein